ncbi:cubilin-like isoform X2 [Haliotis rubra]|uniref:cubilin-like isoform X2 n=1 Tax=Haliotis rubra TaxID=36100 RepID=UPI001EE5860E|nr:cubilin-like isoform X2 [Haliotis rubra]
MMGSMAVHRYSWKTTATWICFLMTSLYGACLSDSTDQCTTTLTASEGYITSPGYPSNYTNNLNCTYVITGDEYEQNITIDLVDLDLELRSNCPYDWLIVDGGPKLCNHTTFHKTYVFQNTSVITFISDGSNTGRGFKMRYSIGVDDTCFSTHFMTSGQISTTNKCTSNCTNTIVGNGKLQTLSLDFVSLNFTTSPNCDAGWLTIDGGPKICTSTPFKTKYAFFGSVDIVTHGGDSCGGFVVNYALQGNCKATLTASEGVITSTGYTGLHTNYLSCTYVIMGAGQAQIISIDMLEMDLEETSDCHSNWLIMDDGPKLCEHTTFHKKYVIRDRFIIMFGNEYSSSNRRGFKMHYSVGGVDSNDTCTSNHLTTSGQISTPCSSCNCTYNRCTNTIIGSGKQQTLTLDIVSLNFTTSPNCDAEWLTIDGGPKICTPTPFTLIYPFWGSVDIVTSNGNRSVDTCPGFVVNYFVQDNCTTTLTASQGVITSPGYSGIHTDYLSCMYIIVGDGHSQFIAIDLLKMDLQGSTDCSYDWLIIDDGLKLCYPARFHKTYTSIHTKTSGQISTPCSSCNCTYNNCTNTIIGSGKLQTLTLDFVSLNFTTSADCDTGWLTIDGGPRICTSTPYKTTHAFFGSVDIVTHGGVNSYGGFVVNYAVEDNCTTTLTANEGEITSPGYPGIHTNYLSCSYVIVGDGHTQSITIDLLEMDLHEVSGCSNDWLIIGDGPQLCSPTTFHKTYAFQDRFIIKFRTDYDTRSRGFKMHYFVGMDANDNCTSTHLKTSGQISTPCSSCNCTYSNCTNTIIGSGKLQTLILNFVSLNFTNSANCDIGWLTIDDGPQICTAKPFKTTYAFFGSVDIVIHGGDRSVDTCGGFVVNYAVQDEVNNTLTYNTNSGQLIGPSFPGTYTSSYDATYIIVGNFIPQKITIDIALTTYSSGSCYYSKLTLNSTRICVTLERTTGHICHRMISPYDSLVVMVQVFSFTMRKKII